LGQAREAVLAAWGICESGEKVLLGLCPGTKEDTVSAREFLRAMAGTDANITFTVTGENGSSSTTMDSRYNSRVERDSDNIVVLPSPDLGELHSVTVQRDDSGNAPDWHVASIKVESVRYKRQGTVSFDCWIDSTAPVTRPVA